MTTATKKPFGGYAINFKGCSETLEQVFGRKEISPSQMTKALWTYVKKNKLGTK